MASIRERNGKFNVIYSYTNEKGERKQKWETYETKAEAKRRKKEIEYKKEMGSFVVRKCKTLDELITEYVALYGKGESEFSDWTITKRGICFTGNKGKVCAFRKSNFTN